MLPGGLVALDQRAAEQLVGIAVVVGQAAHKAAAFELATPHQCGQIELGRGWFGSRTRRNRGANRLRPCRSAGRTDA
ncbi:MAG: hypothetical protein OHK0022_25310 [Roseiflexaceae bacterium]